jgi:hypothetical protein
MYAAVLGILLLYRLIACYSLRLGTQKVAVSRNHVTGAPITE